MTSEVQASDFDSLDFFDVIESNPDVSQSLHDAAFLAQTSKRCDMFDVKQKPINLDNDQSNQNNHIYSTIKILVNSKQKGNSILRHIKSIPYEFNSQIIADYVTGEKTCMLFLSLRYHCLNYNYIPDRMRQVTSSSKFALHILLVLVDTVNAGPLISQLGKLCVQANYTLLLSWSPEEAANYIETYQSLSKKSADTLRPKFIDSCGAKRAVECITSISGVNKTNGLSLITNFGSLSSIAAAKSSVIGLTHGIGDTKAKNIYSAFHQQFQKDTS